MIYKLSSGVETRNRPTTDGQCMMRVWEDLESTEEEGEKERGKHQELRDDSREPAEFQSLNAACSNDSMIIKHWDGFGVIVELSDPDLDEHGYEGGD